jgi:hypothetical protein
MIMALDRSGPEVTRARQGYGAKPVGRGMEVVAEQRPEMAYRAGVQALAAKHRRALPEDFAAMLISRLPPSSAPIEIAMPGA